MSYIGYSCADTWLMYLRHSSRPTAVQLRKLVKKKDYRNCGLALCDSRYKCHKHVHNDRATVRVLTKLKDEGTKNSIHDILKEEEPQFLISTSELNFVNMYATASNDSPFPFFKLVKNRMWYAIPQVRSHDDMKVCPSFFCSNYE
jgi:hypothetical protein